MSAPDDLERSCTTKRRYQTEEVAKAVAIKIWYERKVNLRTYACAACGGFHLTSVNAPPVMRSGWRPPRISAKEAARRSKPRGRRRE